MTTKLAALTICISYLIVSVDEKFRQDSLFNVSQGSYKVLARLCSPLELRVLSQCYPGCWQNSVPCDYRNENSIITLAVGQGMLSAPGDFHQVLTKWLCPQTIQNMDVYFFKASRDNLSFFESFLSGEDRTLFTGFFKRIHMIRSSPG